MHPPLLLPPCLPAGLLWASPRVSSGSQSGANTEEHSPFLPWSRLHCCRFESLQEPLRERRAALEARSRLSRFFRDADEEMAWVQEKLLLATTQDCGQSLSAVWHLQEKHQVWEPCSPEQRGAALRLSTRLSQPMVLGALCLGEGGHWGCPRFFVGRKDGKLFGAKSVGACEASSTTLGPPEERPIASLVLFSSTSTESRE